MAETTFEPEVVPAKLGDGTPAFQLKRLAAARTLIAGAVEKRMRGKRHTGSHPWRMLIDKVLPATAGKAIDIDEENARVEKAAALREMFESRISILIGPAGTGKTTLLRVLCAIPEVESGGVLLLAPTGKARVRMEQQTGLAGALTVAQFLTPLERYDWQTGRYFASGSDRTSAGHKTVIIDECSMLTEEQLAAVLDALRGVDRLVLVGDHRQLPPIGTGRPLMDVARHLAPANIEAVFPRCGRGYAELIVMRRQIGTDRHDLRLADWFSGRRPDATADALWDMVGKLESKHLKLVSWKGPEDLERSMLRELVAELELAGQDDENGFGCSLGGSVGASGYVYFSPKSGGRAGTAGKAESWQVLSPVRAGLHGVDSLNRTIQAQFRKRMLTYAERTPKWQRKILKPLGPQRIVYGDKVISLLNGQRSDFWPQGQGKPYIANGDIGIVVGQYKSPKMKGPPWKLQVEFVSRAGISVDYLPREFAEEGAGAPLELAYALTIHKAQGSEFKTTFVVLPNPCWLLSRELIYTALTRQQERVVLFYQGDLQDFRKYSYGYYSEIASRLTNLFTAPNLVEVTGDREKKFLEEGLIHRTRRGDLVRSKSEVCIADTLFSLGVKNYQYERELVAPDGTRRYPDFTVEDSESGVTVFWEHLGLMRDAAYRRRWEAKLGWYRSLGVLPLEEGGGPSGTLVVTFDDERGGIDTAEIERTARASMCLEM